MSSRSDPRKPSVFRLDDPDVVVAAETTGADPAPARPRPSRGAVVITPATDLATTAVEWGGERKVGRVSFAGIFWASAAGLLVLALGLATSRLLADLFAQAEWLGWLGSGLAALALLSLAVVLVREAIGILRL